MLLDLYLLDLYFEEAAGCAWQEDLIARYGARAVQAALAGGHLDRRPVPCANGRPRWVCRLSDTGREAARLQTTDLKIPSVPEAPDLVGWVNETVR